MTIDVVALVVNVDATDVLVSAVFVGAVIENVVAVNKIEVDGDNVVVVVADALAIAAGVVLVADTGEVVALVVG